jgi:glycosyltransferase involved in cell wall biosynthesis
VMTFSIITATYNVGDSLRRTLDSVLNQTYDADKIEMVVIDGGSRDNTVDIIKEYEPKFEGRLNWVSEKDEGIYHAFNKGIKRAKYEIINFKGAGDWLELNALELVAEAYQQAPEADIMCGMLVSWQEDKQKFLINKGVTGPSEPSLLWDEQGFVHPAMFYRRILHDRYGMYDQKYGIVSDLGFFLKLAICPMVKWEKTYVRLSNFVGGGVSSATRPLIKEQEKQIEELLPMSGFSLLKAKHIQQVTLARGVNSRWVVGDYYDGWQHMPVAERIVLVEEAQEFIKKNKIDREKIEFFKRTIWQYDGRPQPYMIAKATSWVEAIMNVTDVTQLVAIFDKFIMISSGERKIKQLVKSCLPYGVVMKIKAQSRR